MELITFALWACALLLAGTLAWSISGSVQSRKLAESKKRRRFYRYWTRWGQMTDLKKG